MVKEVNYIEKKDLKPNKGTINDAIVGTAAGAGIGIVNGAWHLL